MKKNIQLTEDEIQDILVALKQRERSLEDVKRYWESVLNAKEVIRYDNALKKVRKLISKLEVKE